MGAGASEPRKLTTVNSDRIQAMAMPCHLHLLPFFFHRSPSIRMPAPFLLPPNPSSSQSSGIVAGEPQPLPLWPTKWASPPITAAAASAAFRHCSVCTRRRRISASSVSRAASDALSCSPMRASRAALSFSQSRLYATAHLLAVLGDGRALVLLIPRFGPDDLEHIRRGGVYAALLLGRRLRHLQLLLGLLGGFDRNRRGGARRRRGGGSGAPLGANALLSLLERDLRVLLGGLGGGELLPQLLELVLHLAQLRLQLSHPRPRALLL
uniref:Uncharacterized protein n=1 Tax=Oryza meridionalis TaxID=40149 RepID=A0A0E0C7X5_9ORYZ